MSKYPVLYLSGSKRAPLEIEGMLTPHLCNAWRKALKEGPDGVNAGAVLSMEAEIRDRGGKPDLEDPTQWVFPPKLTDQELYEAEQEQIHDIRKDEGRDPITGRER